MIDASPFKSLWEVKIDGLTDLGAGLGAPSHGRHRLRPARPQHVRDTSLLRTVQHLQGCLSMLKTNLAEHMFQICNRRLLGRRACATSAFFAQYSTCADGTPRLLRLAMPCLFVAAGARLSLCQTSNIMCALSSACNSCRKQHRLLLLTSGLRKPARPHVDIIDALHCG